MIPSVQSPLYVITYPFKVKSFIVVASSLVPFVLPQLKKQVDEARATYKRDYADFEQEKQSVYLDVKSALIDFNNAKESIPVAKLALLNAKEQYALASGRYKTGLGDIVELKDAEITYLNAQLSYYSTLLNYNVAYSNLERVVGTNLQTTTSEEPAEK